MVGKWGKNHADVTCRGGSTMQNCKAHVTHNSVLPTLRLPSFIYFILLLFSFSHVNPKNFVFLSDKKKPLKDFFFLMGRSPCMSPKMGPI